MMLRTFKFCLTVYHGNSTVRQKFLLKVFCWKVLMPKLLLKCERRFFCDRRVCYSSAGVNYIHPRGRYSRRCDDGSEWNWKEKPSSVLKIMDLAIQIIICIRSVISWEVCALQLKQFCILIFINKFID